ncbi:uncharacterized protein LOC106637031 [Copidosoma floridanum]|uniref:uncharacterized protein LOC106637031 n=1 Tax=Copidosoma floridanum TaxID=29053 RepID=UPI0006C9C6FC|nr:uncharacterized protein LOC106637031 [Copidosoma floridanum]
MLDYPRASNAVNVGGSITFVAGILLLMSLWSPYWMQSYEETFSSFKNMGVWQYCFENFRYPYFQFDKLFNGCHSVYSEEYYVIREWLLPGWLLVVQAFVTTAFLLSLFGQTVLAMILTRFPLKFVLENEWLLSSTVSICDGIAATLLFLSVIIFGSQCRRRDWLMYPNFNHLSWSYWLAVISCCMHIVGAFLLYLDAKASYGRRRESRNLIMQMQPNPRTQQGLQRTNYL